VKLKQSILGFNKDITRAFLLVWRADKLTAVINTALQVVLALLPVLSLYFIKGLIEGVVHGKKGFDDILFFVVGFGLVQFLLALIGQYSTYISTMHQQKLTDYLSGEVLTKAVEVDYEYYENPAYHDTLHLAQQQSLFKATQLLSNYNSVLLNGLSMIFLIGFFLTLHSAFAIVFMLLSIPLAIIKWYWSYALLRLEQKFAPMEREANYLHQTLTGVSYAKEVKVFGFGQSFIQKYKKIRTLIYTEKKQLQLKLNAYSLIAEAAEIITMTFIFGLLAKHAIERTITVGVFVIYIQGFQRLQNNSKGFLQSLVQIFQQRIFLKDLFAFFDIETGNSSAGATSFPVAEKGLSVNNVSFTYPQTDKAVLQDVSVQCAPGKIIAIVGENGSGKSTLVKLIARLYHLQTGSIKVDHVDIADISLPDFRSNTVFLFQDFEKYFFSVAENIALGEDDTERVAGSIERAATLSGAHPFIVKLARGYQTRMGRVFKGGSQLSGGQWQKLALARVFYKNAQLVVMDEPTSALDATAEFELFKNVKDHLKDKMVILISHRLYNLKMADYIYVMQNGRIVQDGSFETLTNVEGVFAAS
jgi:ATP-binding cassette subfamily B protein